MVKKPKLLFVFDIEDERFWKDGLFAAIELLEKDFDIARLNIRPYSLENKPVQIDFNNYDFVLGWGAFDSPVDKLLQTPVVQNSNIHVGLCMAGYAPYKIQVYDILFYEVENWSKEWLKEQNYKGKIAHAFGVNTDIFKPLLLTTTSKLWDYLTVGAFALWKRQNLICTKNGSKMALGQIQKGNMMESLDIIGDLLVGGCGVSGQVIPEMLARFYSAANIVYLPADLNGGGERAVLEARACGISVEVEEDNPKLIELLNSPIYDHKYYAEKLKKGILSCIQ